MPIKSPYNYRSKDPKAGVKAVGLWLETERKAEAKAEKARQKLGRKEVDSIIYDKNYNKGGGKENTGIAKLKNAYGKAGMAGGGGQKKTKMFN